MLLVLGAVVESASQTASAPEPVDAILERLIERTREAEQNGFTHQFSVHKVVDNLDGQGRIHERKSFSYQVYPVEGRPYRRLVQKNGHPLDAPKLQEEKEKEDQFRDKVRDGTLQKQEDDRTIRFSEDLIRKFRFHLAGEEEIRGRRCFALSFMPRAKARAKSQLDRILRQIGGTLWVDAEEFQIARLELKLLREISLGWGLIGEIEKFNMRLERLRLGPGLWTDGPSEGSVRFRKILKWEWVRWSEAVSDILPVFADQSG